MLVCSASAYRNPLPEWHECNQQQRCSKCSTTARWHADPLSLNERMSDPHRMRLRAPTASAFAPSLKCQPCAHVAHSPTLLPHCSPLSPPNPRPALAVRSPHSA